MFAIHASRSKFWWCKLELFRKKTGEPTGEKSSNLLPSCHRVHSSTHLLHCTHTTNTRTTYISASLATQNRKHGQSTNVRKPSSPSKQQQLILSSTNLIIILGMMQVGKKIPFDDPTVMNGVRALYILSNVLIVTVFYYIQMKINANKGTISCSLSNQAAVRNG